MSSSRQIRLIGEPAQQKLASATATLRHAGLARWVEEKYLRGAGVGSIQAKPAADERFLDLDPAAREVARGAASALDTIREILER